MLYQEGFDETEHLLEQARLELAYDQNVDADTLSAATPASTLPKRMIQAF